MGIIGTGICMRYFDKVDIAQAKVFIMGILHFTPQSAVGLNPCSSPMSRSSACCSSTSPSAS